MKMCRVVRDCCTSGNCFHCAKGRMAPHPDRGPDRVTHTELAEKKDADRVAKNWERYNAVVVEVDS